MAQNVTIAGASYSDVPSIQCPKTGGGTAIFTDVSDTTAVASDVLIGKYFYTAAGVKTAGTGSGISAYAYVIVYHAVGTTPTCTNTSGSIALSTAMTLFLVSDNATSCVATAGNVSKTVAISSGGSYYVDLTGIFYAYKAGDTGGWATRAWACRSGVGAATPSMSYSNNVLQLDLTDYHSGIAYRTAKVDLTNYSTVTVHGSLTYTRSTRWDGSGLYIMSDLSGSYYPTSSATKAKTELPLGTHSDYYLTADVASLSGEYYIAIGLVITSNYTIDGVYCTV